MGTFLVSVVTSLTGNPSLGVLSIGVLLVVLAIDLVVEGIRALGRNKKAAQAAE